jgi:ribosome-associated protein
VSSRREATWRALDLGGGVSIPRSELEVRSSRSGGPGGQNVNKVETAVSIRFRPAESQAFDPVQRAAVLERLSRRLTASGDLIVRSSRFRERGRNLDDALERLAGDLRRALVPQRERTATRPTRSSRAKRLAEKRRHGQAKASRRDSRRVGHDD